MAKYITDLIAKENEMKYLNKFPLFIAEIATRDPIPKFPIELNV